MNNKKKQIVGSEKVLNLQPIEYPYAYKMYQNMKSNFWTPQQVPVGKDAYTFRSVLNEAEKHAFSHVFAQLSTMDVQVQDPLNLLALQFSSPEHTMALAMQQQQEAIHCECLAEGTKILTSEGFKDFKDLTLSDRVAAYSEAGIIEFENPTAIHESHHEGVMFKFQHDSYQQVVTPNHRMVMRYPFYRREIDRGVAGSTRVASASVCSLGAYDLPISGSGVGHKINLSVLERIAIAFQADGSVVNRQWMKDKGYDIEDYKQNSGYYSYRFSFKRKDKIAKFKKLVVESGLRYSETVTSNGYTNYYIWTKFKMDKTFSWLNLGDVSENYGMEFIKELTNWDGSPRVNGSICYSNTEKLAIDKVIAICSLSGCQSGLYKIDTQEGWLDCWQVHIVMGKNHKTGRGINKTKINYDGMVYCCSVSTGMIVCQYEDNVFVTGNSYAYCAEHIGLDESWLWSRWQEVPAIKNKIDFANSIFKKLDEYKRVEDLIVPYFFMSGIFEGVWFMNGFNPILAMARDNKMSEVAEILAYIARDECISGDTELLTNKGWVKVVDVSEDTTITQWCKDSNTLSFTKPKRITKHDVDHLFRFHNEQGHYDQLVSSNHRVPYYTKSGRLKIVSAKEATPNPYSKHQCVAPLSNSGESLTIDERILIALQADGNLDTRERKVRNKSTTVCKIGVSKSRKVKRLYRLLDESSYSYRVTETNRVDSEGLFHIFRIDIPVELATKTLSDWINLKNVNLEWCESFISEVALWDGHKVNGEDDRITYSCVEKSNTDMVQAVASLAGYRTNYTMVVDDRSDKFNDIHRLHIHKKRNSVSGGAITKSKTHGSAVVHGIEVDDGFILTRRNGAVSITGNSTHTNFGLTTLRSICNQNNIDISYHENTILAIANTSLDLEQEFIEYIFSKGGYLGYSVESHMDNAYYLMNKALSKVGLSRLERKGEKLSWIDEMLMTNKESNFFEKHVKEYQTGSVDFNQKIKPSANSFWDNPCGINKLK